MLTGTFINVSFNSMLIGAANGLKIYPIGSVLALGFVCSGLVGIGVLTIDHFYGNIKECEYKLQKTEQKIGWIKEGSFINNMITEFEEKVVKSREEKTPLTKTMMTKSSK